MTAKRIALLGAPATGKTTLAQALAAHLCGRGPAARAVARLDEAGEDTAAVIIADTSAAVRAALDAGPGGLDDALCDALQDLRRCHAILLTGLDLPAPPDAAPPVPARESVDALLRGHLQRAGLAYQVVYGQGEQRLQSALQALEGAGVLPAGTGAREEEGSRGDWVWNCEKCSDPACEHRLFAKLRAAPPEPGL